MVLQFDQPDGTVVRMTAAQYLEQVRMEAELARQDVSLLEVAAASLPMLAVLGFGVLVITYVPWLTTGLLAWMGRI